jgi:hypothetical protein
MMTSDLTRVQAIPMNIYLQVADSKISYPSKKHGVHLHQRTVYKEYIGKDLEIRYNLLIH